MATVILVCHEMSRTRGSSSSYSYVENLGGPVVGVARGETHLVDLEPVGRRANSGSSVVDFGHVDIDGAEVVSLNRVVDQPSGFITYRQYYLHQWPRSRRIGRWVAGASQQSLGHQLQRN